MRIWLQRLKRSTCTDIAQTVPIRPPIHCLFIQLLHILRVILQTARRSHNEIHVLPSPPYCQYIVCTSSLEKATPQAGHFRCLEEIRSSKHFLQNAENQPIVWRRCNLDSLCIHRVMACCLKLLLQQEHRRSFCRQYPICKEP